MAKTEKVTARVEPDLKRAAEELFRSCGLSTSTAITLFLHRSVQENGLPFSIDGADRKPLNAEGK